MRIYLDMLHFRIGYLFATFIEFFSTSNGRYKYFRIGEIEENR